MTEPKKNPRAYLYGNISIACPLFSFLLAIISPFLWNDDSGGHMAGLGLIFVAILIFLIGCFVGLIFGLMSLSLNKKDKVIRFAVIVNLIPLLFAALLLLGAIAKSK